jgi:radical SAM-linked protein
MAYSAGFHPHPKISYVGAAPTGVGSEAEYLEIALDRQCDPDQIRVLIDAVLPEGLDIVTAIDATQCPPGGFADQMQASVWLLELADDVDVVQAAVAAFLAADVAVVQRLTKDGHRDLDARPAVLAAAVRAWHPADVPGRTADQLPGTPSITQRAILELVVRQVTPSVRPDDVLAALNSVAGFAPSRPARATRVAQGPLDESGMVRDPFGDSQRAPRESAMAEVLVSDS